MQTSIIPRRRLRETEKPSDFSPGGHHLRGRQTFALLLATCAGIAATTITSRHDGHFIGQHAPGCYSPEFDNELNTYLYHRNAVKVGDKDGAGSPLPVFTEGPLNLYADGSVLVLNKAAKGHVDCEVWDSAEQFAEVRLGGSIAFDSPEARLLDVYHTLKGAVTAEA